MRRLPVMTNPRLTLGTVGLMLLATGGCFDLDVTNPNNPDRQRATATPTDLQTVVSSTFSKFFEDHNQSIRTVNISSLADEFSSNFLDYGQYDLAREPREAFLNNTTYAYAGSFSQPWIELYAVISSANDGLSAIDRGIVVTVPACGASTLSDQTARAQAFAKFMQGVAHGYVGLIYDQGFVVDEHRVLEEAPPELKPYTDVVDSAIAMLREAVTLSSGAAFSLCAQDNFIPGLTLSNQDLARMAHSMIARLMVYRARTPAERADADWTAVLTELDAGIQSDINPIGDPEGVESGYKYLIARQRTTNPSDHTRADYMLLGPADTSGRFQTWVNSATTSTDRTAFRIFTPDRRIANASPPSDPLAYFAYANTLLGNAARGLYLRSHYAFYRFGRGETYREGPLAWLTMTEMDYLRAEAYIRLGRAAEAVPIINATRAHGMLPPVTVDGPPDANSCVPQKFDGTCGSLWDAMRYEKRIEMAGVDAFVQWFDARGWGALPAGAVLHFPVPARELEILELPIYTTGGPNPGGAAEPDPERCPVALPRCPT